MELSQCSVIPTHYVTNFSTAVSLLLDSNNHRRGIAGNFALILRTPHEDNVIGNSANFSCARHIVDIGFLISTDELARMRDKMDMDIRGPGRVRYKICKLTLALEIIIRDIQTHQGIDDRVTYPLLCQLSNYRK